MSSRKAHDRAIFVLFELSMATARELVATRRSVLSAKQVQDVPLAAACRRHMDWRCRSRGVPLAAPRSTLPVYSRWSATVTGPDPIAGSRLRATSRRDRHAAERGLKPSASGWTWCRSLVPTRNEALWNCCPPVRSRTSSERASRLSCAGLARHPTTPDNARKPARHPRTGRAGGLAPAPAKYAAEPYAVVIRSRSRASRVW